MARRAERVARAGGSFLGGIANNPGIVIIGLVLGGLFIFRDKISEAFASIGEGFGNIDIELPEIKFPELPQFPEITFPEITFPDFAGFFTGFQEQQTSFFTGLQNFFTGKIDLPQPQKMVEDTGLIDPLTCECGSAIVQDAFGNVNQKCLPCEKAEPVGMDPKLALEPSDAELFAKDFPEEFKDLTPVQQFLVTDKGFDISSFLTQEPTQQFTGGGVGFIGGSIFETPLENLSLSQIIDMFNVTASQASNLKAIAQGFTPEEELFLQGSQDVGGFFTGFNPPAVSDPQFQGLTPEQIALILTGGNIQNF